MERKISAGSYDLNKWLYGGYEKDVITTVYGPAGSGKTNFCMLVAVSQAKKGNKVILIDSEGGFSIDRFKQIAGENYEAILENVLILKPTTFNEQQESFERLLKEIKETKAISAIMIDSMTMLYRLELADARGDERRVNEVNSKLASQMRILAEIARNKEIPVITTNQVYSEFLRQEDYEEGREKRVFMVGGDIMKYWSKCIIELQIIPGKRKAILRKHRSLPESEFIFNIVQEGIIKARRFF
ncbi:MAG: DNA repair and recombination protein RadB [archaeon]